MEKTKIWLSSPHMGGAELEYVKEVFDQNWIAPVGPHINKFEEEISKYTGNSHHTACLTSGTAAIHLALIALGVGPGDEVLCSTLTFAASANPIVYQGATPVFVDSEADTWNMCPDTLEEAIKERIAKGTKPKAIVLVYLFGQSAHLERLLEVAERYDIPVIEDAAEALGAFHKEKALGTFGQFGVYSFNGNKIITSSGGGCLLSKDEEAIQKAKFRATQARDVAVHYQHSEIGYNYRMSNVCAAIGLGQLEILDEHINIRRKHFDWYKDLLKDVPGIAFQEELAGTYGNRWLTCITIDPERQSVDSEELRLALDAENIESRPIWKPMHLQPVFADAPYYGNGVSDKLFEHGLSLPSGSNMSQDDLNRIESVLKRVFKL